MTNKPTRLLRIAYWTGAILDGATIPPMLSPRLGAKMLGVHDFHAGIEYRYAMFVGAALMFGWTVLLLWADRKPIERCGVLPLTVLAVMTGLAGASVYAGTSGLFGFQTMVPMLGLQLAVSVLFVFAYLRARPAE